VEHIKFCLKEIRKCFISS